MFLIDILFYLLYLVAIIPPTQQDGCCNYEFNYGHYLKFLEIDANYVNSKFLPQYIKLKLFRKAVAGGRGTPLFLNKPESFMGFDGDVPTKFIVHGFVASSDTSQVTRIRDACLLSYDNNVITVDWTPFAGVDIENSDQYILAIAFMNEIVAPFIVKHLEYLISAFGAKSSSIQLIGHSLGAHLVGMVGKKVKVDWITGLDPALPGYTKDSTETRLMPTDAAFVEVIHTNVGEYGEEWACGTVDYYINNGGPVQPHSHPEDTQANHAYSYVVYSGALEYQKIEGVMCSNEASALKGNCSASGTKAQIGDRNATAGIYLVKTTYPWPS